MTENDSGGTMDLWRRVLEDTDPERPWDRLSMNTKRPTATGVALHPGFVHYLDLKLRHELFAERYRPESRAKRAAREARANAWNAAHPGSRARALRLAYEVGGGLPVQRALRRIRDAKKPGQPHSEAFRVLWAIVDGRYESPEQLAAIMQCSVGRVMRLAGIGLRRLEKAHLDELRAMSLIPMEEVAA